MVPRRLFCIFVCLATVAYAKNSQPYQSGKLVRMNSVHCGTAEKDNRSALGEIIGTDDTNKKSEEVLCQEYVLQTDAVVYHIRPRDEKHPELLPVGGLAQFRIQKDKLILRVDTLDDKDHQYIVVSMTPRTDENPAVADSTPNHAQ
jgi:hypothetical protein